ncbi:MAG: helix-turn-helix domain-containing protein [Pseudomonadota bacterium]
MTNRIVPTGRTAAQDWVSTGNPLDEVTVPPSKLIERAHTPMFAIEVAALFMHGDTLPRPLPHERQTSDRTVRAATALMRRSIEIPLSIPALASELKVDQRHLEEVFLRELRLSPRAVYKAVRLREARRLVELTTLKVAEIATRCGYQDASALTRAYRSEFGVTPRDHRRGH